MFQGLPARGKTSVDWFFGVKRQGVVNEQGERLNFTLTPGNTDDRKPVPHLLQECFGKAFADPGYVSQKLATQLLEDFAIAFFAKLRRNMKNQLMTLTDIRLTRKRSIVETILEQFKNISQIEYSRYRSSVNFMVNLVCGVIAYCHQPKKPKIQMESTLPLAA